MVLERAGNASTEVNDGIGWVALCSLCWRLEVENEIMAMARICTDDGGVGVLLPLLQTVTNL